MAERTSMTSHERWLEHVQAWQGCQECMLCTQRDKIVLARGVVPCDVLFLGEAPGMSEDSSGLPFWGPAGAKLDEIVATVRHYIKTPFTDAYTNLVACFPAEAKKTNNHQPTPEEIQACSPRLQEFVSIAMPKLIVCVGSLVEEWGPICSGASNVRWCNITHPSAILRMPEVAKDSAVRKCVIILRDAIEEALSATSPTVDWIPF